MYIAREILKFTLFLEQTSYMRSILIPNFSACIQK